MMLVPLGAPVDSVIQDLLILTLAGVFAFLLLRVRLRQPVFQMTLKDLGKDKEWLSQSKTKAY